MSIIYMKNEKTLGAFGKLDTPIKMIIEHESDLLTKKKGIADQLFNVEKSNRFGETIINNNEFDTFNAVEEGGRGENDTTEETSKKFIEHIQFMKEFSITQTMLEDSVNGIASDAKLRAENFARAYYKTRNKLASFALQNGTSASKVFNGQSVDLTTGDGLPVFSKDHIYGGKSTWKQSNYFWGDVLGSTSEVEYALDVLSNKLRNMLDENGEPLGYTADTIVLPGNRPAAERFVKKVCGSDGQLGNGYNDINLQYGTWNIFVDPMWQSSDDRMIIMSSEANKNLRGNMFFNRIPLTVKSWIDEHTWNNCWGGRCRFGVGFGSYKHMLLCVDAASAPSGATTTKIA